MIEIMCDTHWHVNAARRETNLSRLRSLRRSQFERCGYTFTMQTWLYNLEKSWPAISGFRNSNVPVTRKSFLCTEERPEWASNLGLVRSKTDTAISSATEPLR
uniref:Uncharacterized protein n=1 Tax=Anopheles culicifacies TaxID=139723 RepID=A0A182MVF2_9DIPT